MLVLMQVASYKLQSHTPVLMWVDQHRPWAPLCSTREHLMPALRQASVLVSPSPGRPARVFCRHHLLPQPATATLLGTGSQVPVALFCHALGCVCVKLQLWTAQPTLAE
eukprot:205337-Chlamydomonas_euryale.AAC.1